MFAPHAPKLVSDEFERSLPRDCESLAPPGGICISADAWRHVRGAIAADFVDLGEHRLKNIADPTHVFAVSLAA
jgi:class 3 adenylate cyclase